MKDAQLTAFRKTEKEAEALIKIMAQSYSEAQQEITRQLEVIYGRYLATKNPQDYYNIMIQYDRLNNLLKETQKAYLYYSREAGRTIEQLSSLSMSNTYYRQKYVLSWFTPMQGINLKFSPLDRRLIELSVTGTQKAWKQIPASLAKRYGNLEAYIPQYGTLTNLLKNNDIQSLAQIQRAITQNFIQGQDLKQLSNNIKDILETSTYKADRIARTESARTANLGGDAARQEAINQGVKIVKMWIATLDERTRSSHAALDGVKKEHGENFEINGDSAPFPGQFSNIENVINCRCTTVDLVDGVEPGIRRGRNPETGKNEVFEFKTFDKWASENGLAKNKYGELYKK